MSITANLAPTTDPLQLRRTFGCFPSGVAAVCATVDGAPAGMAISSFTTVSLEPPLVSICIAHDSTTWPVLRTTPRLGVSILGADHAPACRQLSSRTADRFAGLEIECAPDGAVFLAGSAAWLDCNVEDEVRAGDHDIVLLRVRALAVLPENRPLVFHRSGFRQLIDG